MKIYLATQQIFHTDDAAYSHYRQVSGGKAEDRTQPGFWEANGYADFKMPTYDSTNHVQTSTVISDGNGGYTYEVRAKTAEELATEAREQFKATRQQIVDNIKVTTANGNTFDGDEISQTRMARAILGMQASGVPSIVWVLADNTVIQASVAELTEAMILAGQAQAAAWVMP